MRTYLMSKHARVFLLLGVILGIYGSNTVLASSIIPFNIQRNFEANRSAAISVELIDQRDSRRIEQALVQVGDEPGTPFVNNQTRTDVNGKATIGIPTSAFDQPLLVSVSAEGYPRITFEAKILGNRIGESQIQVSMSPNKSFSDMQSVTGSFSSWPTGISRSRAEVGLFLPGFKADTLLSFDLGSLISSRRDEMPVAGRTVNVPGNLVLPRQSKRYGFIPITMAKPNFNMPLLSQEENRFSSVAGSLPISEMVDLARAKDYLGIVNLIEFSRTNWTDWQSPATSPTIPLRLDVELQQRKLKNKVRNHPAGLDLLSIALLDPDQSKRTLIPVDIKSVQRKRASVLNSVNMRLAFPQQSRSTGDAFVFNAAIDQSQLGAGPINELSFTAAFQKAEWMGSKFEAQENEFLPIMYLNDPSADRRQYSFRKAVQPEVGASSMVEAEFYLFNLYSIANNAGEQTSLRTAIWSAVLPGTADSIRLPKFSRDEVVPRPELGHPQTFYWEVIAIRRRMTHTSNWDSMVGLDNLRQVSHARKAVSLP